MTTRKSLAHATCRVLGGVVVLGLLAGPVRVDAQKALPEVTIAIAVSNMAFAAVWVAEHLQYFEQEGVHATITVAGGGAPCLAAVVSRSVHFCASSSEGLLLARAEGAPLLAIQAHNRALTLSVAVRKALVEQFGVTRQSPLQERLKVLTHLGTIGATSPGAVSEQIFKFLVGRIPARPEQLKFVYLGGNELPPALMKNVIDAFALSPPAAESTEAAGHGYVLIPLGLGEIPELTNYPFEVLMARPDFVAQHPLLATAVTRAISRGGALFHRQPEAAQAALRGHRFFNPHMVDEAVFHLAYATVAASMPPWGDMTVEGWQKVIAFATGAGIVKEAATAPSAAEGVLWTNKYVGKGP